MRTALLRDACEGPRAPLAGQDAEAARVESFWAWLESLPSAPLQGPIPSRDGEFTCVALISPEAPTSMRATSGTASAAASSSTASWATSTLCAR